MVPLEAALQGVPGVSDVQSYSEPELSPSPPLPVGTSLLHARQLVQGAGCNRRADAADLVRSTCDLPDCVRDQPGHADRLHLRHAVPLELSAVAQWTIRPRVMSVPRVAEGRSGGPRGTIVEVIRRRPAHEVTPAR